MSLKDEDWTDLLYSIQEKKCTPFIGAGASAPWLPLGRDIAKKWAEEYDYPLQDSNQLSRVAQFLEIKFENAMFPRKILSTMLKRINPPDFALEQFRNTPYAVLADLNLPIYITTNYDQFMEAALRSKGKDPVSEFCRWNNYAEVAGIPSVFNKSSKYKPTEATPLVYHLHGDNNIAQSMVLTESDYIDFILNLNMKKDVLPAVVLQRLATSSLLFIGYSLEDISFRIIFRGIMNLLGMRFQLSNVAVLLPPFYIKDDKTNHILEYLDKYTKNMFKIHVYWGDASEFSAELRKRLDEFRSQLC